jgi:hypothetical protein
MRAKTSILYYWAPKWEQNNFLDGHKAHLCLFDWRKPTPFNLLFKTRRECEAYIKGEWGYIARRNDLKREPHCWRVPKAVRVKVTIQEATKCQKPRP